MIGAIILLHNQEGNIDPAIWQRIGDKSILEYTVYNALRSELIQKVVVCGPVNTRRTVTGGGLFTPALRGDIKALDRVPQLHFYENTLTPLAGLYRAALKHELDAIICLYANSPLIEPWLINYFARLIAKKQETYIHNLNHNPGFGLSAFTFTMLADALLYSKDKVSPHLYLQAANVEEDLSNSSDPEIEISKAPFDLRFTAAENQHNQFDFLLNELNKGADINDLIGDLYDKSKKAKE